MYGMGSQYMVWGVSKRDMLVNRLECKYTGLGVCIWDGVFGYLFTGWSINKRNGMLVNGLLC